MEKNILWLASWYPNKLTPFDGDFIQRQAKAVSVFNKLTVIHLQKDTDGSITKNVKEEIFYSERLTEIIVFYHPFKTKIKFLDKIISIQKYKSIYRSILKKYLHQFGNPSIIHLHVAMKAGLQPMLLKNKKIPYFLSEHWSGYYSEIPQNIYNSGWIKRRLTKAILKNASMIIAVANSLEIAIKKLIDVKCLIIPNVVDTKIFFYDGKQTQNFRFIHVSSMNYSKNPEGIIRAAKLLAEENFQFELIFIGSNDDLLIKLTDDLGLLNKHIFFKGEVSYSEVAEEMQASSALIMFSRFESLPCVILEALCCGLPVVSSDVGGIKEVINYTNGILMESENEKELKNAMKKMIVEYYNYNRRSIADDAEGKYNYEVVGKQIFDAYKIYS